MPMPELRVPDEEEEEEEDEEDEEGEEEEESEEGAADSGKPFGLVIDEIGRVEFEGSIGVSVTPSGGTGAAFFDNAASGALLSRCEAWAARAAVTKQVGRNKAYSRGSTYWISSETTPRCGPERMALDIFNFHTQHVTNFDKRHSGAEWWTLVLDSDSEVGWHWDKDYGIEASMDLNVYPQVGTVTYFTDEGVPTVALDCMAPPLVDDTDIPEHPQKVFVSYPRRGRHFAFDGRFLHGAKEIRHSPLPAGKKRTTLLVNVWVNHKPVSASRFPQGGCAEGEEFRPADWEMSLGSAAAVRACDVSGVKRVALREDDFIGPAGQRIDLALRLPAGCGEGEAAGAAEAAGGAAMCSTRPPHAFTLTAPASNTPPLCKVTSHEPPKKRKRKGAK